MAAGHIRAATLSSAGTCSTCTGTVVLRTWPANRRQHYRLDGSPVTASSVAGPGWMYVRGSLRTVLETGQPPG